MSPRRTILRELDRRRTDGGNGYTRPASIRGFEADPSRYQEAVNALLREQLVNGTKDEEGRLAIALNERRMDQVQRELRPVYARPAVWLVLVLLSAGAMIAAMAL